MTSTKSRRAESAVIASKRTTEVNALAGVGSQFDITNEVADLEDLSISLDSRQTCSPGFKRKDESVVIVGAAHVAIVTKKADTVSALWSNDTYARSRQRTTALCNMPLEYMN